MNRHFHCDIVLENAKNMYFAKSLLMKLQFI